MRKIFLNGSDISWEITSIEKVWNRKEKIVTTGRTLGTPKHIYPYDWMFLCSLCIINRIGLQSEGDNSGRQEMRGRHMSTLWCRGIVNPLKTSWHKSSMHAGMQYRLHMSSWWLNQPVYKKPQPCISKDPYHWLWIVQLDHYNFPCLVAWNANTKIHPIPVLTSYGEIGPMRYQNIACANSSCRLSQK